LLASTPWVLRPSALGVRPADAAMRVKLVEPRPVETRVEPLLEPRPEPQQFERLLLPRPKREDTPPKVVDAAPKEAAPRLVRASPPERAPGGVQMLSGEAARKAAEQVARELLYPAEAIARGQEGEALVLLFLDEAGNAIAARVESSSGHALLDAAAVRAARTLRSLPGSAPREALLPVRFRLN
jgi:periplasmic protein TonB